MDMKIRIQDPIGLRTGIRLDNIKSYIDSNPEVNHIRIYGTMAASADIAANQAEPEICCGLFDSKNRVCYSLTGEHAGLFWISRYTIFRIELLNASRYFNWNEIDHISLFVIFRERRLL